MNCCCQINSRIWTANESFHVTFTCCIFLKQVVLTQEVEDGEAEELVNKCPVNVFDIEDVGKGEWGLLFGAGYESFISLL